MKVKGRIVTEHPPNPLVIAEETDHGMTNEKGIGIENVNEGVYEIKMTNVIGTEKEREIGQGGTVTVMTMMNGAIGGIEIMMRRDGTGGEAEAARQGDMKDTSGSLC